MFGRFAEISSDGDVCSTGLLVLTAYLVGARAVEPEPALRSAGLRLAAAALFALVAHAGVTQNPATAQDWLIILVHSLAAAGVVLGLSWTALAVLAYLLRQTVTRPLAAARRWLLSARRCHRERRERREAGRRERVEHERSAPERERARLRAEAAASAQAEAQRRREDARASALLSFSFYAAKLGNRFSREMFDQYLKEYMGDQHPAEVVERRGEELIAVYERHLADVGPKKPGSIASLTRWYEETKAQIEALPLERGVKDVRLVDLERRFDELLSRHLEGTEP